MPILCLSLCRRALQLPHPDRLRFLSRLSTQTECRVRLLKAEREMVFTRPALLPWMTAGSRLSLPLRLPLSSRESILWVKRAGTAIRLHRLPGLAVTV